MAEPRIRVLIVDDHAMARIVARRVRNGSAGAGAAAAGGDGPSAGRRALTARELDVLAAVARGLSNRAIAQELGVAERTARTHVSNILAKLELSSRTQAALYAVEHGLDRGA